MMLVASKETQELLPEDRMLHPSSSRTPVAVISTGGAGNEQGLAAAEAALSDPLAYDTGVSCTSAVIACSRYLR